MNIELVGITEPDGPVLKSLPALMGQDSNADGPSDNLRQGDCRCLIRQIDDHLEVWDLGTRGGTFVNGSRVTKATLKASDRLGFGGTEFSVRYDHGPQRYLYGLRC
jgi:hypothetical protein